jgi:hypothetical protein
MSPEEFKVTEQPRFIWTDTLIRDYIHQKKLDTLRMEGKDTLQTTWLFDQIAHTDTATYLVFEVGHSFEHHYIPDKWLYIDSLTRNLYEYDLPADSLIKWKQ